MIVQTLKAMPIVPKVLLGSLVLMVIYGLGHHRYPSHQSRFDQSDPGRYESAQSAAYGSQGREGSIESRETAEAEQAKQYLAQFQAQQSQLLARANACMAQMRQASNEMAMAAMNGQMMNAQPPCEQYMPQWTAQEAYLETEIYRLQSGDRHSPLQQITGVQVGQPGESGASSYYHSSGPGNDGGIGAVERYDRQAIRGTSLYNEPDGTEHELPTEPYYYRNQNSGQIVASTQPNPPNDGSPYDPLTPQE